MDGWWRDSLAFIQNSLGRIGRAIGDLTFGQSGETVAYFLQTYWLQLVYVAVVASGIWALLRKVERSGHKNTLKHKAIIVLDSLAIATAGYAMVWAQGAAAAYGAIAVALLIFSLFSRFKFRKAHQIIADYFVILASIGIVFIVAMAWILNYLHVTEPGKDETLLAYAVRFVTDRDYLKGVLAESSTNLLSFVFITLAITLKQAQQGNPRKESLYKKIQWIFNTERRENHDEIIYMQELIKQHLIYSSSLKYYVTYSERYDDQGTYYKISVKTVRKIENMHDEIYENHNIRYSVLTDGIVNANGIQGELVSMAVIRKGEPSSVSISPVALHDISTRFDQVFDLAGGEELILDNAFWTYHREGENFVSSLATYTKEIVVEIANTTQQSLSFASLVDAQPAFLLSPGERKLLRSAKPQPGPVDLFRLDPAPLCDPSALIGVS